MKKFFSNTLNIILTISLVTVLFIVGFLAYNYLDLGFNRKIIVPDFSNMSEKEVADWAKENKLNENQYIVTYEYDDEIPEGKLVYQSIKPNEEMTDHLKLIYSKGKDPNVIIVIDFSGMNEEEIKKWANENAATVNIEYEYSDDVLKGKVIRQNYEEGTKISKDKSINIIISNGKADDAEINVPDSYLGYSEADFVRNIEELGLKTSKQSKTYKSSKYKTGSIYAYDSTSDGNVFKKGDTVKYWLVDNEAVQVEEVVVPDSYLGYTEANFIKAIEALGLKVSKQTKTYTSSKYQTGCIYAYDSTSDGITFKKGDSVKYWLVDNGNSVQNEEVIVPDSYLGYTEANFIKAIEGLGLKASKQSQTYKSNKYQTGCIYSYDSTSDGIVFKKGDTVKYWLVDNTVVVEEDVTLTNLVGKAYTYAYNKLVEAGLNVSKVETYSDSVAKDYVISMNPGANNKVKKGSTVTLTVSKGPEPVATASILAPNFIISSYSTTSFEDTKNGLITYFSGQGFTNVSYVGISSTKTVGQIESVSVNGNTGYSAGDYPLNTPIVVQIVSTRLN